MQESCHLSGFRSKNRKNRYNPPCLPWPCFDPDRKGGSLEAGKGRVSPCRRAVPALGMRKSSIIEGVSGAPACARSVNMAALCRHGWLRLPGTAGKRRERHGTVVFCAGALPCVRSDALVVPGWTPRAEQMVVRGNFWMRWVEKGGKNSPVWAFFSHGAEKRVPPALPGAVRRAFPLKRGVLSHSAMYLVGGFRSIHIRG